MHGPTDISPVGMAAALHLDLAIHNFGIQEYMPHNDTTLEVFQTSATRSTGASCILGERPASVSNWTRRRRPAFPYTAAYLPVNRLQDGTIHDW